MSETPTPEPRHKVRLTDEIWQAGELKRAGDTVELRRDQVERLQDRIRPDDAAKALGRKPRGRGRGAAAGEGATGGG